MFRRVRDKKGEMTALPFEVITSSELLTGSDLRKIEDIKPELQDNFKKVQIFRTDTERRVSVLDDISHPTPASKYWQAVREQDVHFNELVMMSYEYRKIANDIERKKKMLETGRDSDGKGLDYFDKVDLKIDVEKLTFALRGLERVAKARIGEITDWSKIKAEMVEKMKPEELTDVDAHQLVSYAHRFIKEKISMGDTGSPAERKNLDGQLHTALKACAERDLVQSILKEYPARIGKLIEEEIKLLG